MTLASQLEAFGLTKNEADVYVAALRVGSASIQDIAEEAKLNRVTVYGVAESLMHKGFLREERVKNKRRMAAYPPMKLYDLVGRHEESVKKERGLLDALVPELKRVMGHRSADTNMIYYEGEEGIKNWASDALETSGELLEWTRINHFRTF